jgi:hypothetical protein
MHDLNQIYSQYMIDKAVRERATDPMHQAAEPDTGIMEPGRRRWEGIARIIQLLRSTARRPVQGHGTIRVNDRRQPS